VNENGSFFCEPRIGLSGFFWIGCKVSLHCICCCVCVTVEMILLQQKVSVANWPGVAKHWNASHWFVCHSNWPRLSQTGNTDGSTPGNQQSKTGNNWRSVILFYFVLLMYLYYSWTLYSNQYWYVIGRCLSHQHKEWRCLLVKLVVVYDFCLQHGMVY